MQTGYRRQRFVHCIPAMTAFFMGLCGSAYADSNLLENPGFELFEAADPVAQSAFESTDFASPATAGGWTFSGHSGPDWWDGSAHAGSWDAFVNAPVHGVSGSVSQSIATIPGESYLVSFYLSGNCCAGGDINVSFGSTGFSQSYPHSSSFAWEEHSFSSIATAANTLFLFSGQNLDGTFFIDDISIIGPSPNPVPLPSAFWLLGSALASIGIIGKRGGKNDRKAG
jgi:hypothetical protein